MKVNNLRVEAFVWSRAIIILILEHSRNIILTRSQMRRLKNYKSICFLCALKDSKNIKTNTRK